MYLVLSHFFIILKGRPLGIRRPLQELQADLQSLHLQLRLGSLTAQRITSPMRLNLCGDELQSLDGTVGAIPLASLKHLKGPFSSGLSTVGFQVFSEERGLDSQVL